MGCLFGLAFRRRGLGFFLSASMFVVAVWPVLAQAAGSVQPKLDHDRLALAYQSAMKPHAHSAALLDRICVRLASELSAMKNSGALSVVLLDGGVRALYLREMPQKDGIARALGLSSRDAWHNVNGSAIPQDASDEIGALVAILRANLDAAAVLGVSGNMTAHNRDAILKVVDVAKLAAAL